jgi:hypothetical protein
LTHFLKKDAFLVEDFVTGRCSMRMAITLKVEAFPYSPT